MNISWFSLHPLMKVTSDISTTYPGLKWHSGSRVIARTALPSDISHAARLPGVSLFALQPSSYKTVKPVFDPSLKTTIKSE